MKILLTGASSFSGFWFARALSEAGHEVVAPLRRSIAAYTGDVRAARVAQLGRYARIVPDCEFGSAAFFDLIASGRWDLLCHHAATVTNYRSPAFDVSAALEQNTRGLPRVLAELAAKGMGAIVLTGSVFEQNEGAGSAPLRAFSPYGLSKGLTAEVFTYWCSMLNLPLGKFVIPNPFGPFEEPRFCAYLAGCWKEKKTAEVKTPAYVRDNVPIDLLARGYALFCGKMADTKSSAAFHPSCYAESQGAFTARFAAEIGRRLDIPCPFILSHQTEFTEPAVRVNTQPLGPMIPDWDEAQSWDALARYYSEV